jgi:hypothetical protein
MGTKSELVQRGKRGIRAACCPAKIHYAHGKCKTCYYKDRWDNDPIWRKNQQRLSRLREKSSKMGERRATYRTQNKKYLREKDFFDEFHFNPEEWLQMYHHQKGLCFVCGRKLANRFAEIKDTEGKMAAFDHCHKTGLVRGLLCRMPCNRSLGGFFDDVNLLRRALEYVEHPPATVVFGQPAYTLPGKVGTKLRRKRWKDFGHLNIRDLGFTKVLEGYAAEKSKSS